MSMKTEYEQLFSSGKLITFLMNKQFAVSLKKKKSHNRLFKNTWFFIFFSCVYLYVCFCVCGEQEGMNSQINPDRWRIAVFLSCSERSAVVRF